MKRAKLKKKLKIIKAVTFIGGFLLFIIVISGMNNTGKSRSKSTQDEALEETSTIIPGEFSIEADDYKGGFSAVQTGVLGGEESVAYTSSAMPSRGNSTMELESSNTPYATQYSVQNTPNTSNNPSQADMPPPDIPNQFDMNREYSYTSDSQSSPGNNTVLEKAIQKLVQSNKNMKEVVEDSAYITQGRVSGIFVGEQSEGLATVSTGNDIIDGMAQNMSNMLGAIGSQNSSLTDQGYNSQNNQQGKQEFLAQQNSAQDYVLGSKGHALENALTVISGSVIPIVMVTGINSDLPGMISARVSEDVYDSLYGTDIIIPKGSTVVGAYDSSISWGQNRLLVAWQRLVRPDGYSLLLEGMQGTDTQGLSGMTGKVNTRIGAGIASAALISMFDLGVQYSSYQAGNVDESGVLSSAVESTGSGIGNSMKNIINKMFNRQPTISIPPGARANIFVNKDIVMPSFIRK